MTQRPLPLAAIVTAILVAALAGTAFAASAAGAGEAFSAAVVEAAVVERLDPDECAPFEVIGSVMEADPERGVIVVAEREIRGLNAWVGGKEIKTQYLDEQGKPRPRGLFRKGETVVVEGFRHPEGFIAATRLQKLEKRPLPPQGLFQPVEEARRKFQRRFPTAQAAGSKPGR